LMLHRARGLLVRQYAGHLPQVLRAPRNPQCVHVRLIEAKIAREFKRQYAKLTSDEIMVLALLRKRLDCMKAAA
jgi:hypothetical protein